MMKRRKSIFIATMVLVLSMLLAGCGGVAGNDKREELVDGSVRIQQSQIPMVHPKKFLSDNLVSITTNVDELAQACEQLDIKPLNVAVFNSDYYQKNHVLVIGIPASKTNKFTIGGAERQGDTLTVTLNRTGDAGAAVNTNVCVFLGFEIDVLEGIENYVLQIEQAA